MYSAILKILLMTYLMSASVQGTASNRNPKALQFAEHQKVTDSRIYALVNAKKLRRKRQIFREQVLPHAGGRIPDTAFESDRLFLNQLQKDGIALPDGIVTEQRNPQVYPFFNRPSRKVYRIALSSDGRYTAPEGRYHYQELPSVETTYLYPQIHGQQLIEVTAAQAIPQPAPISLPVYRPFRIHNPLLNQVKFQPKDKAQFQNVSPVKSSAIKPFGSLKAKSYQNINILNTPLAPLDSSKSLSSNAYLPNFSSSASTGSSHLFSDFDKLFNQFDGYNAAPKKTNSPFTSSLTNKQYGTY